MTTESKTIVLTLPTWAHPNWEEMTPFRLEISESESTRLFVLSEMVNWFDLPNHGKGYPPGVEVWRKVARVSSPVSCCGSPMRATPS